MFPSVKISSHPKKHLKMNDFPYQPQPAILRHNVISEPTQYLVSIRRQRIRVSKRKELEMMAYFQSHLFSSPPTPQVNRADTPQRRSSQGIAAGTRQLPQRDKAPRSATWRRCSTPRRWARASAAGIHALAGAERIS